MNVCPFLILPVCLSTVKNFSPSSTLYTTRALLPYVGSSASDAVTFITDVPVEERQANVKPQNITQKMECLLGILLNGLQESPGWFFIQ